MKLNACVFAICILPVAAGASLAWGGETAPRPNIVLIMADDMGFSDLGCYGGEIETPNLDRLAERGMRFTSFYNNAKCNPTRASLLTGLYAQQVGTNALRNCATIAEALRPAGYRTLMSGKWHLNGLPVERGFDRYFGLLDGACNFWNPGHARPGEAEPARKMQSQEHRWAVEGQEFKPYTPEDTNFYTTDAFTDYAIERLKEYSGEEQPFFLYLAYNAPHYPLHAWPEDIARYRGRYLGGWDRLREERYERMIGLGLFDRETCPLPPRDERNPSWESVANKEAFDLKMAVYAAMIDRMDRNIGRLVATLESLGKLDDTLILFLSDNGGSSEHFNSFPEVPPGPMEGFHTVDAPWANASNTPFRKYKGWNHEGGICTPLIAFWPNSIEPGRIEGEPGHVIDIMPTCLELAGAAPPETIKGRPVQPLEGRSLAPLFRGEQPAGREAIFWQYGQSRAVRQSDWKLAANGAGPWELYDLSRDRNELDNLAARQPERTAAMAALWDEWAKRVGAKQQAADEKPKAARTAKPAKPGAKE